MSEHPSLPPIPSPLRAAANDKPAGVRPASLALFKPSSGPRYWRSLEERDQQNRCEDVTEQASEKEADARRAEDKRERKGGSI